MALIAKIGKDSIKLRTYQFPSRGNQPEDYYLVVNGEKLDKDRVRTTGGGGKSYTYIKMKDQVGTNQSYWLEGALGAGTAITVEEVEDAKPKAAAPAAAEAKAEAKAAPAPKQSAPAPKQPAPQRPGKKK